MSTLKLRKLQIGKSNNDNENITLFEKNEPDGSIYLGMGTIESIIEELVKFTPAGLELFNPKVLEDISLSASGKEMVHASWVIQKILENGSVPTGSIIYVTRNTIPSGFLKCNGAAISRTTYSTLFNYLGTTYGVGDGSTTFSLPDLRGVFIRGLDESRGLDLNRLLGSYQEDELKSHTHTIPASNSTPGTGGSAGAGLWITSSGVPPTGTTGGTETRPVNIALIPCIRYL